MTESSSRLAVEARQIDMIILCRASQPPGMLESKHVITEQVEIDRYRCHEEEDQGEVFEKGVAILSVGGKP